MKTIAKFFVGAVEKKTVNQCFNDHVDGPREVADVKLHAVCGNSPENEIFFASTPTGFIELNILNLPAAEIFAPGAEIYVTFSTEKP